MSTASQTQGSIASTTELKAGCYRLDFQSADENPVRYSGTFRVTRDTNGVMRASGDLYAVDGIAEPAPGIPNFPIAQYRYYMEVTGIDGLNLQFHAHKYNPATQRLLKGRHCQLKLAPLVDSETPTYAGTLARNGKKEGEFRLEHISDSLRQATLRIFRLGRPGQSIHVPGLNPGDDLNGHDAVNCLNRRWNEVFSQAGWDWTVQPIDLEDEGNEWEGEIEWPDGPEWTPFQLAQTALGIRKDANADDWIFDLLCVSRFEKSYYLGLMFDSDATDLNQRPRESAAVAALQDLTMDNGNGGMVTLPYQMVENGEFYFRTAIHELGHCLNLTHSLRSDTLMDTTDFVLERFRQSGIGQSGIGQSEHVRINLTFADADVVWLQHAPDIAIRPGGLGRHKLRWQPSPRSLSTTVFVRSEPALKLSIQPVDLRLPLGAPVRLDYEIANTGPSTLVPADISLRGGFLSGSVRGPDKVTRHFRNAFKCCNGLKSDGRLTSLAANGAMSEGMTLLRGVDGPLFPVAGAYQIGLVLRWDYRGQTRQVTGECNLIVEEADPGDPFQAIVASLALHQPDLMPAIVQGQLNGSSVRTLGLALNSERLAPYYAAIALRCFDLGVRHGMSKTDWEKHIHDALKSGERRPPLTFKPARPQDDFDLSLLRKNIRHSRREGPRIKHLLGDAPIAAQSEPSQSTRSAPLDPAAWMTFLRNEACK